MTDNARNIAVGAVALTALGILCGMILFFAGLPERFQTGYELRMVFPATADAHRGDPVHLSGMRIGKITDIDFTDGDPRKGVTFVARIDEGIRIPASAVPRIYSRGIAGGAYIQLEIHGAPATDLATGKPILGEYLPVDRVVVLQGELKTGVFPEELTQGIKSFTKLADRLTAMLGDGSEAAPPGPIASTGPAPAGPPQRTPGLKELLVKLNTALDSFNDAAGAENRQNLKTTLANLAKASKQLNETLAEVRGVATRTGVNVDLLSKKIMDDAEKLAGVLDELNKTVRSIRTGDGTAAKLINDPQLYDNLVVFSDQLTRLIAEMREMTREWKKEGVTVKLK